MKSVRRRLLITILIIANLSLASYVLARRYVSGSAKIPTVAESHKLPNVDFTADDGRTISTSGFAGTSVFVQLINPEVEAQVAAFVKIRQRRPQNALAWLVLTENSSALRARLPSGSDDVIVVQKDSEGLRQLFSLSRCCTQWAIFDKDGNYRDSGRYDNGEAASQLLSVVDGTRPFSTDLLSELFSTLNEQGQFAQLNAEAALAPSGKAVIAMLSRICTGCPDGVLVDDLNNQAKTDRANRYVVLLPGDFTATDVKNLKSNLGLEIPVKLAGQEFTKQWELLNEQYGEKTINGTVFVLSKGKVASVSNGLSETKRLLKQIGGES